MCNHPCLRRESMRYLKEESMTAKLREKLSIRSKRRRPVSCEKANIRYVTEASSANCCSKLGSARHSSRSNDCQLTKSAVASITNLPPEISETIIEMLDLVSRIRLRQTCRTLYLHRGPAMADLLQDLSCRSDPSTCFARHCFAERFSKERNGSP